MSSGTRRDTLFFQSLVFIEKRAMLHENHIFCDKNKHTLRIYSVSKRKLLRIEAGNFSLELFGLVPLAEVWGIQGRVGVNVYFPVTH